MERFSCENHLDEIIDLTVVDWEAAPDFALTEGEETCFLCGSKAKYRLYHEDISQE
jgi:CxxH/CxxC protein (TIGR04129 family)